MIPLRSFLSYLAFLREIPSLFLGMTSLFLGKERAILRNRLTIRLTDEEKDQKRRNRRERNTGIVFESSLKDGAEDRDRDLSRCNIWGI